MRRSCPAQVRLIQLQRSGLAGLAGACFCPVRQGSPVYDDAIFAAVKVPAQDGRAEENEISNTEWEKP
jgi:hypothetical protein